MGAALTGRTAIVCGASSGMGLAIAERFREEGANVVMFARRTDVLEREASRLGAVPVAGDVRDASGRRRLVDTTVDRFGGVDILVNNSGGPPRGGTLEMGVDDVRDAVELLLVSAVDLTLLCVPHLRRSGKGRVINVESSTIREPAQALVLSNAVRPGVAGWMKTLAGEVGTDGVTVNTLAPGRIDTDRMREVYPDGPSEEDLRAIPLRRLGKPREVAAVAAFLASDAGAYVSGAVIPVDGGLTRGLY